MNNYFAEIMTGAMVLAAVGVCVADVFVSAYKERKEIKVIEQRERAAQERHRAALEREEKAQAERAARIYREQRKVKPCDGEDLALWPETKVMRTDSTLIAWN